MELFETVFQCDDYLFHQDGDGDFRFAWDEPAEELLPEPANLLEKFHTQIAYGKANGNSSVGFRTRLAVRFRGQVSPAV